MRGIEHTPVVKSLSVQYQSIDTKDIALHGYDHTLNKDLLNLAGNDQYKGLVLDFVYPYYTFKYSTRYLRYSWKKNSCKVIDFKTDLVEDYRYLVAQSDWQDFVSFFGYIVVCRV